MLGNVRVSSLDFFLVKTWKTHPMRRSFCLLYFTHSMCLVFHMCSKLQLQLQHSSGVGGTNGIANGRGKN